MDDRTRRQSERESTSDREPPDLGRREFLLTAASSSVVGLAGCPGTVTRTFTATPVVLPESVIERREYTESVVESITTERTGSVAGVDFEATIESSLAVYDPTTSADRSDAGELYPDVGSFATPDAAIQGNPINPLATASLRSILAGDVVPEVRTRVLTRLSRLEGSELAWREGPTAIDEGQLLDRQGAGVTGDLLGEQVEVGTFGGVARDSERSYAVLLFVARRVTDDVAIVAGVLDRPLETGGDGRPIVGDEGYFVLDQFAGGLSLFVDLLSLFQVKGSPGTITPTPSPTPTPTPTSGSTASGTVIDDFEDGNRTEYRQLGIVNDSYVNSPTKHGSKALKFANMYSSYGLASTGGLPNYPHLGDRFRAWFQFPNKPFSGQSFGLQFGKDATGRTHVVGATKKQSGNRWGVTLSGNGSPGSNSVTVSLAKGTWYAFDVSWGPKKIELDVIDSTGSSLGSTSVPSTGDSGSDYVAFKAYPGQHAFLWDYAHIVGGARSGYPKVIDDFEDGNTTEYRQLGIVNSSVVNSPAKHGSSALKFTDQYSYGLASPGQSTGRLPHYPHMGDQFRAWFRFEDPPSRSESFTFGFGNDANGGTHTVSATKKQSGSDWEIRLRGTGSGNAKRFTQSLSRATWYAFDVSWGPNDIDLELLDDTGSSIGSATVSSNGDNGDDYVKFGAQVDPNHTFLWDYVHIVGPAR